MSATRPRNGTDLTDEGSPRVNARQLDSEIAVLRGELAGLVTEVDRRRHELFDVRLQARRHAIGIAIAAVALVSTASAFVWLQTWRSRRRRSRLGQVGRLREAASRMIDRPERVATEPSVPAKILTAAANAAVAVVIKKIIERWLAGSRAPSAFSFRFKPAMPDGAQSKMPRQGP